MVVYALVQREARIVQLVDLIGVLDVVAYLVIYDTCGGDESADENELPARCDLRSPCNVNIPPVSHCMAAL